MTISNVTKQHAVIKVLYILIIFAVVYLYLVHQILVHVYQFKAYNLC